MTLKIILLAGLAAIQVGSANAAYLSVTDWYSTAVMPTLMSGGSLVTMPSQSVVATDYYGSYTVANQGEPVDVSNPPYGSNYGTTSTMRTYVGLSDGAAGSLIGHFACASPISGCLGAHTVTYTLPFEITGMAGNLDLGIWYLGSLNSVPFFELTDTMFVPYHDEDRRPGTYNGFWGKTFEPTDTLTVVWTPGLQSADAGANFWLSDLLVLTRGAAPTPVSVPEPASMALFGVGVIGLVALRHRRAAVRSATQISR